MIVNTRRLTIYQAIFFAFMITMNVLANALPLNGYTTGEISAMYPNLFVPAGFTFSIWGVIYLLLLAYVVYTSAILWKKNDADAMMPIVKTIAPYFILTCALNGVWIMMWHLLLVELSLLFMIWLLATLILTYVKLQQHRSELKGINSLLYVPFVVYLGWISVATIANATALLVHYKWAGFGIDAELWSCIMITVATMFAIFFTIFRRDFSYSLIIMWALYGISVSQHNYNNIVTIAYTCIGLCGLLIILVFVRGMRMKRT